MSGLWIFAYVVGLLATIFYCALAWYAGNFFGFVSGLGEGNPVPGFSRLAIAPLDLPMTWNMIHWQLVAFLSFFISVFLAARYGARGHAADSLTLPLLNHFGVLLLMLLINLVGFVSPMVAVGYVIE